MCPGRSGAYPAGSARLYPRCAAGGARCRPAMAAAALEFYRRQYFAVRRAATSDASGPPPILGTDSGRLPAARAAAIRNELQRIFDELAAAEHASAEDEDDLVAVNLLTGF